MSYVSNSIFASSVRIDFSVSSHIKVEKEGVVSALLRPVDRHLFEEIHQYWKRQRITRDIGGSLKASKYALIIGQRKMYFEPISKRTSILLIKVHAQDRCA